MPFVWILASCWSSIGILSDELSLLHLVKNGYQKPSHYNREGIAPSWSQFFISFKKPRNYHIQKDNKSEEIQLKFERGLYQTIMKVYYTSMLDYNRISFSNDLTYTF